jgi:hypothetical protein
MKLEVTKLQRKQRSDTIPDEFFIGLKFGKLTVTEHVELSPITGHMLKCVCECGNIKTVQYSSLKSGRTTSCGCLQKKRASESNVKHGKSDSRLYGVWKAIRARCENPKRLKYEHYGGRGIAVCFEWHDFDVFCEWALEHGYKEGLTIDRIDTNGNYEPSNCRWVTQTEQLRNQNTRYDNTSGVRGVSWDKKAQKWFTYIHVNKKRVSLGRFVELQEATKARKAAEEKYWG